MIARVIKGASLCYMYLPKLKAEVDNTNRGLDNSCYHVKAKSGPTTVFLCIYLSACM